MIKHWTSILEKVFVGYEMQKVHRTFCWMLERSNGDIPHRQRKRKRTEGSYEGILAPIIQKEIAYRLLEGDQVRGCVRWRRRGAVLDRRLMVSVAVSITPEAEGEAGVMATCHSGKGPPDPLG